MILFDYETPPTGSVTGCQNVTIGLVWQHSDRDDTTGSQYPVGVQPKKLATTTSVVVAILMIWGYRNGS